MEGQSGFWSYVHQDDDDEGQRISGLADLLGARVRFLTGSSFQIFLDRESIGWGDDWEARIDEALLSTTFFLPILTPSYFLSEQCRRELLRFSSSATALGLQELILPIYYADVPDLESSEPADELMALVRRFNWEDLREVALEDVDSSLHRKAVHRLAKRLLERAVSANAKPTQRVASDETASDAPGQPPSSDGEGDIDTGREKDANGVLDILSEGEKALPRLNDVMTNQLSPLMEEMGQEAADATEQVRQNDAQGKGFAGRLNVSRHYAARLDDIANRLEPAARSFLEELLRVDAMVQLIFRLVEEDPGQAEEMKPFFSSVRGMATASEEGLGSAEGLAQIVKGNARFSKDLRGPSLRIATALRQLADARSITRVWLEHLDELEDDEGDGAPGA